MIYAKAMPYSDPTQVGKFYISWDGKQPMISSTDSSGNTVSVIDTSYTAYNVADVTNLSIVNGSIVVI